ncbi:hypothetical protein [Tolypothrix sp. NIES-4075]|uniref:hypothetical protein n=1 Tax=Tolypothrix sp. NIES-4075 TaxID=2005459 RepID=UPI00190ED4CD|nr:hypothetical protein [Tolypothrix sp. NIES-4075]
MAIQICQRLLEYAQVSSRQCVLDIATGTGHIAIAASQIVGSEGRRVKGGQEIPFHPPNNLQITYQNFHRYS